MPVFKWWIDLANRLARCPRPEFLVLGGFLVLLLSNSSALALPEDACIKDEKCKEHYTKAIKLYKDEDFDGAMNEFQAAYVVRQMPLLLVNIGRTLQKLGRPKEALGYYERYLQAESKIDPETKKRVDEYIVQVRAAIGPDATPSEKPVVTEVQKPPPPVVPLTPPPPPPPPSMPGRNLIIGGAILTAVGVGGLIAAIGLGVAANGQFNTFKDSVDEFDKLAAKSSAQSFSNGAIAAGILGTAVGATGVTLIVMGRRINHRQQAAQGSTVAGGSAQESAAPAALTPPAPPIPPASLAPPASAPAPAPASAPASPTAPSPPQALLTSGILGSGVGMAFQGGF